MIVGYAAGGAVDVVARTIGQSLATGLGQPVIVENRPGAGTNIAVKATIQAEPDGHTLMMAANALAANPALYQPSPFDPERGMVAISLIGRVPVVLAANMSAPWNGIHALVEAAKGRPNAVAYASPGNGSTPHMAIELFARAAGVDLMHLPYKGGAPAITDTIGGQVPLVAVNALEALPHVRSGRLKLLAVLGSSRSPTIRRCRRSPNAGYPGFEASVWYGVVAPAATPPSIVARLHAEIQKALRTREVVERIGAVGGEVTPGTQEMFTALIRSERQRYARLVTQARIVPD
jgi:tripartite-type tricarboxylate transporter receptor subunit TctC